MKKLWKSHFHKHNLMKLKELMFLTRSIMKLIKRVNLNLRFQFVLLAVNYFLHAYFLTELGRNIMC